jgi:hypothetical protein
LGWCLSVGLLHAAVACTILDEDFEPVSSAGQAGGSNGGMGSSGAAGERSEDVLPACASDAGVGVLLSSEGSICPGGIPLVGADGDAGQRGDGGMPVNAVGSLERCENGLGNFGSPERITGLGVNGDLFGPSISADGLTLYFAAASGDTEHIYVASRSGSETARFSPAVELTSTSSASLDGTPFISFDGLGLYFFSDRAGGTGSRDLWSARRDELLAPFGAAAALTALNTPALDMSPSLSRDELTIHFASSRPNGRGTVENTDIWRSTRASTAESFGAPENVGELNSGANEGRIVFSSDGLLAVFSSDRAGGRGFPDLWIVGRLNANGTFGPPVNLGSLNSPSTDQDVALTADDRELFFASERGDGPSALYRAVRPCLE